MKLNLLLVFFFSRLALANPAFYVLGENYLLYSKEGESPIIWSNIEPKSWAMDTDHCRLWVTSNENSHLFQFEKGKKISEKPFFERIVSDVNQGKFATVDDFNKIRFRDEKGEVVKEVENGNVASLKKLTFLSTEESVALFQSVDSRFRDSLWLSRLNVQGSEVHRFTVEGSRDLWGNTDTFLDEKNDRIWVGYSGDTSQHTYSPLVKSFTLSGALESSFQWNDRGLFFDGCLDEKGDFFMARDIPTMPYTVPVYSFLEKLKPKETPERVLELDLNLLVDSVACEANLVYFAVHSILGGEARQIMVWSKNKREEMKVILPLPSRAKKIFLCE
jgi:hypothetical protein